MGKPLGRRGLTAKRLRFLLDYDKKTGIFRWKNKTSNRVKVGDIAGAADNGYTVIRIDGVLHRASALAIFHVTGKYPKDLVDHRDRDTTNNRFKNLREATYAQNGHNAKMHKDNSTGYKGVHQHHDGRYRAQIHVNGKRYNLGVFDTAKKAHAVYMKAAKERHKEFFNPKEVTHGA